MNWYHKTLHWLLSGPRPLFSVWHTHTVNTGTILENFWGNYISEKLQHPKTGMSFMALLFNWCNPIFSLMTPLIVMFLCRNSYVCRQLGIRQILVIFPSINEGHIPCIWIAKNQCLEKTVKWIFGLIRNFRLT